MTLPFLVDFHPGCETPLSLASRLAVVNGFASLRQFLAITDVTVAAITAGKPEALESLCSWSGVPILHLEKFAVRSQSRSATWALGPALMSRDMRVGQAHRFCPKCVIDDLSTGRGRESGRPYVRAQWLTRAYTHCVGHSCDILEHPVDATMHGDFARFVAKSVDTIQAEATRANATESFEADRYVSARVDGEGGQPFLDTLEAYVAIDLCLNVGRFEREHREGGVENQWETLSDTERGFRIACKGPTFIEVLVADAVNRKKPPSIEMSRFFGKLRLWLRRNIGKEEFVPVIELFQGIAERNLPIGSSDTFIMETRRRYLHSVRSASIEFNMMEERVHQLMIDAGLSEPSTLTSGRIYFDADAGERALEAARETMTSTELALALGINVDRVRSILDAGLIERVEVAAEGSRIYSRVRRQDFEAFEKKLQVPFATAKELENLIEISSAARHCASTLETSLACALDGNLKSLRRAKGDGLVSRLVVDLAELKPLIFERHRKEAKKRLFEHDGHENLLTARQAERRLATASGTVRELVRLGYLKRRRAFNPITKRSQEYVCGRSLAAFQEKHVSLARLSDEVAVFPGHLRKRIELAGVKAIFEPTGRNSRYYRLDDIRQFRH
ncbi:TniQ family protein [Rhizobium leguminosarum]|uniref:TniQ family protein n=1 Tax=Rhizobium leguminosarum TaxID=384 RepID=UPI000365BC93|nr:TniQ family protein [Rhizobium leguminosarum]